MWSHSSPSFGWTAWHYLIFMRDPYQYRISYDAHTCKTTCKYNIIMVEVSEFNMRYMMVMLLLMHRSTLPIWVTARTQCWLHYYRGRRVPRPNYSSSLQAWLYINWYLLYPPQYPKCSMAVPLPSACAPWYLTCPSSGFVGVACIWSCVQLAPDLPVAFSANYMQYVLTHVVS